MPEWLQELVGLVGKDGAWASFCLILLAFLFWFARALFRLQGQTVEVLIALKTMIQALDCLGGKHDDDAKRASAD